MLQRVQAERGEGGGVGARSRRRRRRIPRATCRRRRASSRVVDDCASCAHLLSASSPADRPRPCGVACSRSRGRASRGRRAAAADTSAGSSGGSCSVAQIAPCIRGRQQSRVAAPARGQRSAGTTMPASDIGERSTSAAPRTRPKTSAQRAVQAAQHRRSRTTPPIQCGDDRQHDQRHDEQRAEGDRVGQIGIADPLRGTWRTQRQAPDGDDTPAPTQAPMPSTSRTKPRMNASSAEMARTASTTMSTQVIDPLT